MLRLAIITLIAVLIAAASGCGVSDKKTVPTLLQPIRDANTEQLITEVNRIASLKSLRGKVDIQFEDTSFAQLGLSEKYKTADGTVVVQRPEKINLKIQAPFIGTTIAEMTSDGEHFRVAVLQGDEKYRRFLKGTNNANYPPLKEETIAPTKDRQKAKEQKSVSAFSNIRPQHFTDALLLKPIRPRSETGFFYSQSEFFNEEPESKEKPKNRVMRSYYLLDELAPNQDDTLRVVRRFWFDRVNTIRLARVQTFDEKNVLISDVTYSAQTNFGENNAMSLPRNIEVTRIKDNYKLTFKYQEPEAVSINDDYAPEVFLLENTRNLPEVDLDKRNTQ